MGSVQKSDRSLCWFLQALNRILRQIQILHAAGYKALYHGNDTFLNLIGQRVLMKFYNSSSDSSSCYKVKSQVSINAQKCG